MTNASSLAARGPLRPSGRAPHRVSRGVGWWLMAVVLLLPLTLMGPEGSGRFGPSDLLLAGGILLLVLANPGRFVRDVVETPAIVGFLVVALSFPLAWLNGSAPFVDAVLSPAAAVLLYGALSLPILKRAQVGGRLLVALQLLCLLELASVLAAPWVPGLARSTGNGRVYSLFAQIGTFGTHGALLCCLGAFPRRAGASRLLALVSVLGGLAMIWLDGSRAALVGGLLGLAAGAGILVLHRIAPRHRLALAAGALVLVATLAVAASIDVANGPLEQLVWRPRGVGVFEDAARVDGYQFALESFRAQGFIGRGFHSTMTTTTGQVVHNAFLQLAVDVWPVSSIALFLIWGWVLWTPLRAAAVGRDAEVARLAAITMALACVGFVRQLTHPFGVLLVDWLPLWIVLGLVVMQSPRRERAA